MAELKGADKTGLERCLGEQEDPFPEPTWQLTSVSNSGTRGSVDDSYLPEEKYGEHIDLGLLASRAVKMDFCQVTPPRCVALASLGKLTVQH